ncbi:MAG: fibronectin type III domain-containing protein, partial [Clostridia bacterium]|nr:fibronectin type III domain-containing protein [Clostridia bacterium]
MNTGKRIISLLMCMLMVLSIVPMSVFASGTVIDTVALTMPEAEGETLNLDAIKVPDDAEYEIDRIENFAVNGVDCMETGAVLVDEDHVVITVRVNVKGEATFSETLTATVNGNNAYVSNAPVSIKIRYEFCVGGGAGVVDTVDITMPEAEGETLNLDAIKVPDGAAYKIEYIEYFTVNGSKASGNEAVLKDCDRVYLEIRMKARGTATFTDDIVATVNGNTATLSAKSSTGFKLMYEFYVGGGAGVVDTVDITMPEAPGETLNLAAIKAPDGAAYKIEYIVEFTVNGYNSHEESLLQRGDEVCIKLYIKARGTAAFADEMTATVNGKAATVSAKGPSGFKLTYEFTSNTIIDEINLTYDASVIDLNTAWTEGEVNRRVRDNVATTTEGASVDGGNSGLRIKQSETDFWGVDDGSAMVDATKNYAIKYNLYLSEGYDWLEAVKEYPHTGIKVKINGTDVTDEVYFDYNDYWNELNVYYVIGNADTTPIVTDITVSDNELSVVKGGNHTFTAEVKGTVADKTVKWTVEGATSAKTVIDATGKLTVGTDETAETVTVKATANADSTKFAIATVTVTEQPPYISSVDVSPSVESLYTGAEKEFNVDVYGTQTDKSVTWTVEGATSAKTTIDSTGKLTIGSDETAATLTVKATANKDNTKFGTSTVTVKQKTRISEINLTYDLEKLELNTTVMEHNVDANIKNNVKITDEGVIKDGGNSGLSIRQDNGDYWGIGDGSAKVSVDKNYAIKIDLKLTNACDWPESVKSSTPSGITVKINGVDLTDEVDLDYNSAYNKLTVYISLEKATCPHTYDNDCDAECNLCTEIRTAPHTYDNACDAECNNCPATRTPAAHKGGTATCTDKAKCSVCGEAYGSLKAHTYRNVTTKATLSKNGKVVTKCSVCGNVSKTTTVYYPNTIKLSKTAYTYNGKVQTSSVTVKDSKGNTLKKDTDYTVKYESGRKAAGKYTVTITFKGKYTGTKTLTYTIVPKVTSKITATQTTTTITLKWNKVTGADGYRVYKYNSKTKKYEKLKDVTKNTLKISKLKAGTAYKYKVKAYTKDDGTIWGDSSKVFETATKCKTPSITKLTTTKDKASFTWSNVSGESGYQVYYSTKKDSGYKKVTSYKTNVVKGSKTKLKSGKKYYFKVRAYKKTASGTVYSSWSAVKSVK